MSEKWPSIPLRELLTIQNGFAFDSKQFSFEEGMQLIRIRDLRNGRTTESKYAGEYKPEYVVQSGDYLIGMDGEFRCYEWHGEPSLLNQRVCRFQNFDSRLDKRFLLYGVNKFLKDIEDVTAFATVKHISSRQILDIEFPLPPLDEQKRIVAKLDQALGYVDRALHLEDLRFENVQRLLTLAVASQAVLGRETKVDVLSNIAEKITKGTTPTSLGHKFAESGINFIKVESIAENGSFIPERFAAIDEACHSDLVRSQLRENDVLVSIAGALGRTALVTAEILPANTNQAVALVRLGDDAQINPDYLFSLIYSGYFDETFSAMSAGAAQQNLSLGQLGSLSVPVIPREQQIAFVERATRIIRFKNSLVEIHSEKVREISGLRSSILSAAFAGDL